NGIDVELLVFAEVHWLAMLPVIYRCSTAQYKRRSRRFRAKLSIPEVLKGILFYHFANLLTGKVPLIKDGFYFSLAAFFHHGKHALLAFGKQDFPGLHIFLAGGDFIQIDSHTHATGCTHFRSGAGDS